MGGLAPQSTVSSCSGDMNVPCAKELPHLQEIQKSGVLSGVGSSWSRVHPQCLATCSPSCRSLLPSLQDVQPRTTSSKTPSFLVFLSKITEISLLSGKENSTETAVPPVLELA